MALPFSCFLVQNIVPQSTVPTSESSSYFEENCLLTIEQLGMTPSKKQNQGKTDLLMKSPNLEKNKLLECRSLKVLILD